ncbi:unnamed protein product [Mytilus coruscus]|uniref:Uncharacterized protein n=1 Tax=Mytilus coruscus TaxID=42192 RepID=A0A6J8EQH5_MYTCO|nr:unnamed protein product [Mytilus coruscus]
MGKDADPAFVDLQHNHCSTYSTLADIGNTSANGSETLTSDNSLNHETNRPNTPSSNSDEKSPMKMTIQESENYSFLNKPGSNPPPDKEIVLGNTEEILQEVSQHRLQLPIHILSFNIEGIKWNSLYLSGLEQALAVICIQEHWLYDFQKQTLGELLPNMDYAIRYNLQRHF